jgi:hypothetical protein
VKILEALEDLKRLRAFNVDTNNASGITRNEIEFLITPSYISMACLGYIHENSDFTVLLDAVAEILKPRVTAVLSRFDHVLAWEFAGSYEEAFTVAAKRLLKVPDTETFTFGDMAVLVDGSVPSSTFEFQTEYGVVNSKEARERLTRPMGRMALRDERGLGGEIWTEKIGQLPEIALYIESRWIEKKKIPQQFQSDWYAGRVDDAKSCADDFAAQLLALVSGEGDNSGDEGGRQ